MEDLKPEMVTGEDRAQQTESEGTAGAGPTRAVAVLPSTAHLGLSPNETRWAAIAHASILLTVLLGIATGGVGALVGIAVPLVIWYAHRGTSEYVVSQARQAVAFQVAGIVALIVLALGGALVVAIGWAVSAVMVIVLIGLLLLPVMLILTMLWVAAIVALPFAQAAYGCYAAVEAHNGRPFRYRWVADLIERYEAQI